MTTTLLPAAPIILVTTAHPTMHQHPGPAGEPVHPQLGRLLQPRHLSSVELTADAGIPWAADNDCFQGLDEPAYRRMLDRLEGLPGCLFVTVPDVVGDAATTLAQFDAWAPELEARGFPLGLVAQDGMSIADLDERAPRLAALFIGGSTEFKEGAEAAELAIAAKAAGLWVHWGRVNTRRRFDLIVATGAADSFDGSKWARFRKTYLDGGLEWLVEAEYNRAEAAGLRIDPIITTAPTTIEETSTMLDRSRCNDHHPDGCGCPAGEECGCDCHRTDSLVAALVDAGATVSTPLDLADGTASVAAGAKVTDLGDPGTPLPTPERAADLRAAGWTPLGEGTVRDTPEHPDPEGALIARREDNR